ncbi:uncharacterized protein MYCFIDRAFT_174618 [Pseudocercospora fijiensis CIRAD86]|uniref:Uncharacterized protein n=1 Tax=Pseudocercospora fijiensis (strain CIRAD86) TaxID=383855 RepID=M2YZU7_PSEFD|nr:uncharacterized protein MYCFIDRAFT_174618 [Pseudocercospora fijiensis CIRAD86]EME83145.1 hypothetical protein MYCFIDRAFT_174618 [Pseudocercospora fijiensis CIRAD86]
MNDMGARSSFLNAEYRIEWPPLSEGYLSQVVPSASPISQLIRYHHPGHLIFRAFRSWQCCPKRALEPLTVLDFRSCETVPDAGRLSRPKFREHPTLSPGFSVWQVVASFQPPPSPPSPPSTFHLPPILYRTTTRLEPYTHTPNHTNLLAPHPKMEVTGGRWKVG